MTDQRRYTESQVQRIQESGEAPPEGISTVGRIGRNMAVGIPRSITDIATLGSMIVPGIKAGLSSDLDMPEAMFGKEGMAEIQSFVQEKADKYFAQLPKHRQTERNYNAIALAWANSNSTQEIMFKHNPTFAKGMKAGDTLNEAVGLGPVRKETIVDDAAQILGSALIPSSMVTKPLAKVAAKSITGRVAKAIADTIVPGTAKYTPTGIAANTAVPLTVSQGLRYGTDQPSLFTGDALGADSGVNSTYDPDPDDPDMGMGAEQIAGTAGAVGSMALAATVLSGKANKAATKQAIDAIDKPKLLPDEEMQPSLSTGQHVAQAFDDSAPLRAYLSNAYGGPRSEGYKKNIGSIERLTSDTGAVNMMQMRDSALYQGVLDGLDRKTVPASHLFDLYSKIEPTKQKAWDDYIIAMDDLDKHNLRILSAKEEQQLAAAKVKEEKSRHTIADLEAKTKAVADLEAETAALDSGITVKQAREMDAQIKADPVLSQLTNMHRQVYNDMLDANIGMGINTKAEVEKLRGRRPNYMPKYETPPVPKSTTLRALETLRNWTKGTERPLWGGIRTPSKARATDADAPTVKNPKKPLEAMMQHINDHIDFTTVNASKRDWVEIMRGTDDWDRTVREVHVMPMEEFNNKGIPKKYENMPNVDVYFDKGQVHVFQVADPLTHQALQFHRPIVAGFGFNLMRKGAQWGTTGPGAPEFASISAKYDKQIIGATKQPGRVFGLAETAAKLAFPDSKALQAAIDTFNVDPTRGLSMILATFSSIKYRALNTLANKIANDLRNSSGLFSLIGKQEGVLENVAKSMITSLNETRYAQAMRYRALDAHLLDDPLADVRPKYEAVRGMLTGPLKTAYEGYLATLDSIHNSAKYAFFAQNLAVLERKYKGKIPEAEIKKLASETRRSSGDMTRSPGNWYIAKAASSIPYANIAINSALHLGQAVRRDPISVGSRILTGAVLPKVASVAFITSIPALADWYWNELTPWQRMGSIPVIGPDWWYDLAKGEQRALRKSDIYLMRETPEMSLFSNPMVLGLRALGVVGGPEGQVHVDYTKEFFQGMEGMTSMSMLPALKAIMLGQNIDITKIPYSLLTGEPYMQEAFTENPQQYGNPTGINADSDIPRSVANAIGAMFGVANQNLITSIDVGLQSYDKDGDIAKAFRKLVEFDTYQRERRMDETPGTRELGATLFTDGYRRVYAGTSRRLDVVGSMRKYEEIKSQMSAERDTSGVQVRAEAKGIEGFKKIQDPRVRDLALEMHQIFGQGPLLSLAKDRSELNLEQVLFDKDKENMSPRVYHLRSTELAQRRNKVDEQMQEIILDYERSLTHRFGRPMAVDDVLDLVQKSLGQ